MKGIVVFVLWYFLESGFCWFSFQDIFCMFFCSLHFLNLLVRWGAVDGGKLQPVAKSSLQLIFVNKNLLEHSNFIHLFIVYGCVHPEKQSWVVMTETTWPTKPKIFVLVPYRKVLLFLNFEDWRFFCLFLFGLYTLDLELCTS